eukprot:gene12954-13083_t
MGTSAGVGTGYNLQPCRGAAKKAAKKTTAAAKGKGKKGQQGPVKKTKQRMESKPFNDKDPLMQKVVAMLVPPTQAPEQHTRRQQVELEARSKEYSRLKMHQHRAWQHDLTVKLRLKQAAIQALPPALRAAALQEDLTPFPLTRHYLYDHPPDSYKE